MAEIYRNADSKGRVALPGFANATVIIERIDDTEYRVRRAKVIAEKDLRFHEDDLPLKLSARDAAGVLEALANPPEPNRAARRAAKRFRKQHGRVDH
ncbi:MAG TPA: hypothetical protein VH643_01415 [Gemmataceae bacterium]|jgi:uncharacterized protein (DUF1778 family)